MTSKFKYGWQNIETRDLGDSTIVWLKVRGLEIFGVHIQTLSRFGIDNKKTSEFMGYRTKNSDGIYFLPNKYDVYIRLYEYSMKPHKKHHVKYLKKHQDIIDAGQIDELFSDMELKNKMYTIVESLKENKI